MRCFKIFSQLGETIDDKTEIIKERKTLFQQPVLSSIEYLIENTQKHTDKLKAWREFDWISTNSRENVCEGENLDEVANYFIVC